MDFTLGLCKNWVHENDAPQFTTVLQSGLLPGRWLHRWRQAMKSYPELRDLLVSLAYLELTGLQAPSLDAIQWVEENAEPLVKLSSLSRWNITQKLSFQFSMWHARHELPRDMVAKLAEVVSNHDVFHCPSKDVFLSINECRDRIKKMTEERRDGLESRASLSSKTPSQRSSLGPQVYKTYFQTLEAKPKEQPRLFQLLNLWLTPRFIRNASDTKNKIEKFEKRWYRLLRQIEAQRQLPESFFDRLSELNSETDSFESESKQVVDEIHQFCESMQKISPKREFNDSNAVDWFALLSPLPDNLRTGMFLRWTNFIERDFERCDDFTFIANQFARLLKRKRPSQSLIEHWQGVILENQDDVLAEACDGFSGNRKVLAGTVRLLGRFLTTHPANVSSEVLESAANFFAATNDLDQAEALMRSFGEFDDCFVDCDDISLAIEFSCSLGEACELLKVIAAEYDCRVSLEGLRPLSQCAELKSAIARMIKAKQFGKLDRLHWITLILKHFGSVEECIDQISQQQPGTERSISENRWITDYPVVFHDSLNRLVQFTGSGEKAAGRILSKNYPNERALIKEVVAIEFRLKHLADSNSELAAGLAARLENLKSYLEHPQEVSHQRIFTLIEKLDERVLFEVVECFVRHSRVLIRQFFSKTPNADLVLDKLLDAKHGRILAGVLQLSSRDQKLGLRLLFESEAGTTDCFDEEPKNVQFLEEMKAAGFNPDPWVNSESWDERTKNGESYTLAFTDQVLDYLLMGFHFDTCLSPGDVKFFSTITNAVDVNKKVLYGKTKDGRVVGRCLFAINDQYQVLTYHRYQHDESSQFDEAVNRYVKTLCEKMNTRLGSDGSVPNLVAIRWYSDSAVGGEPGRFSINGEIDRAVRAAAPVDRLPTLLSMISHAELINQLSQVLSIAEQTECKTFIQTLLHELIQRTDLSSENRIELAFFAFENNFIPLVNLFMGRVKSKTLLRFLKRDYCCEHCSGFKVCGSYRRVFGMLLQYDPSLALRALRSTRPSQIRDDEHDQNKHRLRWLSRIHRKLGRTAIADRLEKSSK